MAHVGSIRGLSQYIKKIRAASTQEERDGIVQNELAKIRQKYSSSKKVSAYDRKKYTWKLLYSHMMGYDVDFGHKQAADLIPSNNFEEKQVGYQALTILLNEEDEFMMLPVNNVMKDLGSRSELFVSASLCFAGSVAGPEMSAAIAQPVMDAVLNQRLSEHCRKKAALCLLRIYHKLPEEVGLITPEQWADKFYSLFSAATGTGMHLALCALLLGVIERQGPSGYEKLQPVLVKNLSNVIAGHGAFGECLYYGIPSPWLQCKYLRLLALMPPDESSGLRKQLETPLRHACEQSVPSGKSNQNPAYARTAVLTEAAQLCLQIDCVQLLSTCLVKMTSLIERKDPNTRYIALGALCTLCESADMASALQPALPQVVGCLSDADPGVKKRAIDLLVNVCDQSSVEDVAAQLLRQLPLASAEVRGELVVKVAILAERYAPSLGWYIQTMLALMDLGSEEVSDDVWFRAVQAVAGSTADRPATTEAIAKSLESGSLSVPLVSTAGYVLAEFADQVPDRSPAQLAEELTPRLALAPVATQGLLLTALMKLRMHAPHDKGLKRHVEEIFTQYASDANTDIQQRAVEYLAYSKMESNEVVRQEVFAPMPDWPDKVMLFTPQPSQDHSGQGLGYREQEGAFAEAAAEGGAGSPAGPSTATRDEALADTPGMTPPGNGVDTHTADAGQPEGQVDDAAEDAAEAPADRASNIPPEEAAPRADDGLVDLLGMASPARPGMAQAPPMLAQSHDGTTPQPPAASGDNLLFGLDAPGASLGAHQAHLASPAHPLHAASAVDPLPAPAANPFQQQLQQQHLAVQDPGSLGVPQQPQVYQPPDMTALSLAPAGGQYLPPDGLAPQAPYYNSQDAAPAQAHFDRATSATMSAPQAPQMGHPLDSGAVLSTTSAPVPSAAAPESQLSTFHSSATTGVLQAPESHGVGYGTGAYPAGAYSSGSPPHRPHPSMPAPPAASLNPFAAAAATGGPPGLAHTGGYNSMNMASSTAAPGFPGGLTGGPAAGMTGPQYSGGMSGGPPQYSGGATGPPQYSGGVSGIAQLPMGSHGSYGSVGAGGSAGVPELGAATSTANPFAAAASTGMRAPLDTTSTAALMTPLAYSPDRDRMLYLGKGVLLEDSLLQVGFVAAPPERASGSRSVTLFCGNKLEGSHLADFSISLSPSSCVPSIAISGAPGLLNAQEQAQATVVARGVGDSGSDPAWSNSLPAEASAAIAYTNAATGQRSTHRVEFPLTRGSFAVPAEYVSQAAFFAMWSRLAGGAGGPVASGMARLPAPVASGEALSGKMLKLGFSDGGTRLDPTSELNFAGETVLPGGGQALARVEVNPADCAHINVTVVSNLTVLASEEVRSWGVGGLSFLALAP